jgi:hypothetical protein
MLIFASSRGHLDSSRSRVATIHKNGSSKAAHPTATYRIDQEITQVIRIRNIPANNIVPKMTSPTLRHNGRAIHLKRTRVASSRLA